MKTLILTAALLACPITAHASDIPGPPSTPCNLGQRMNVHFVDGWMYECECVVLSRGFHCSWNLVGQVAAPALRRIHKHRRLIPALYIKHVIA